MDNIFLKGESVNMTQEQLIQDKYRGVLIGTAIGDTLGMPVEGWTKAQILRYVPGGNGITKPIAPFYVYDTEGNIQFSDDQGKKLKYYSSHLPRGGYTDDTALTLAVAEGIVEASGFNLASLAQKHIEAFDERVALDPEKRAAFGASTILAVQRMKLGISPDKTATSFGPGNGPAMKLAPWGVYMHAHETDGRLFEFYEEDLGKAEHIGRMTHLDPRSVVSGVIQADLVYGLLQGNISAKGVVESAQYVCSNYEQPLSINHLHNDKGPLEDKVNWIDQNSDASDEVALEVLKNNSLVFRSYPFTLFMFQKYWDRPLEGLLKTVNAGGDCDTTGAMYGALMGARLGMSAFPKDWVEVIEQKERILKAADGLFQLRKGT